MSPTYAKESLRPSVTHLYDPTSINSFRRQGGFLLPDPKKPGCARMGFGHETVQHGLADADNLPLVLRFKGSGSNLDLCCRILKPRSDHHSGTRGRLDLSSKKTD